MSERGEGMSERGEGMGERGEGMGERGGRIIGLSVAGSQAAAERSEVRA
jgi:hypothetical protein